MDDASAAANMSSSIEDADSLSAFVWAQDEARERVKAEGARTVPTLSTQLGTQRCAMCSFKAQDLGSGPKSPDDVAWRRRIATVFVC